MSKKLLIGLFAIVMCFALVGCSKDNESAGGGNGGTGQGQSENGENNNQNNGENDDYTNSTDRLTMKLDYGDGDELTSIYYFKNGKCVGKTGTYVNNSLEIAESRYQTYLEHPYYKDVKLEGVTITFKYTDDGLVGLKGMNKDTIRSTEEAMGATEVSN